MKPLLKNEVAGAVPPAVHLEFIQNHVGQPEKAGIEEVEAYHRALFLHHHAHELEGFRQQTQTHEERLVHLEARLNGLHGTLSQVESLIPVSLEGQPDILPSAPWNHWDRTMFVASALGIASLLIFGVLNISFNLLESGLVTFVQNPVRAYFWAALLPVGALAVKVGWDLLPSRRLRNLYLWICLAVGLAGVLAWVAAYAAVYPALSKSTREQIDTLSVFDQGPPATNPTGGAKWIDAVTVVSQAAAEIFLSAVLGMYMTSLYLRHRPVRLVGNPLFTQVDEERRELERVVEQERRSLADAKGNQNRLENQLVALLSFARSMFLKEAERHRDQSHQRQVLLGQISEQLRSQLESVENHRLIDRRYPAESVTPGNQNGR